MVSSLILVSDEAGRSRIHRNRNIPELRRCSETPSDHQSDSAANHIATSILLWLCFTCPSSWCLLCPASRKGSGSVKNNEDWIIVGNRGMALLHTFQGCPVLRYLRIGLSYVRTLVESLPMFKFHRFLTRFDLLCLLALLPNTISLEALRLLSLVDSTPDGGVLTAGNTSHCSHVSLGYYQPEYFPWS